MFSSVGHWRKDSRLLEFEREPFLESGGEIFLVFIFGVPSVLSGEILSKSSFAGSVPPYPLKRENRLRPFGSAVPASELTDEVLGIT